jgi:tripeptide aminopeptidase
MKPRVRRSSATCYPLPENARVAESACEPISWLGDMRTGATKTAFFLIAVAVLGLAAGGAQSSREVAVNRVRQHAGYQAAVAAIDRDYARFVSDIAALAEVPAPPFKEAARTEAFASLMRATRPASVEIDNEGNVLVLRRGAATGGQIVALAAHLDTVFPEGTDVRVRRDGTRLHAPGVGDNAQGLAALVAVSRAMDTAGLIPATDVLLVGNVGEEGAGDLRGMKSLFSKSRYRDRIRTFIAVDGAGDGGHIVTAAVGSRRYRVTFHGPGGHSYGAFGIVNPATAVAAAAQALAAIKVPASPRTTHNVGAIGGGTSVNTIPSSAWMDVDLRSESAVELEKLDRQFKALVQAAADGENRARSPASGRITVEVALLGARPSGQTSMGSALVESAVAATRALGLSPSFGASSSDANWPMSLGIPSITIDAGLPGGRAHAPDEWIDTDRRYGVPGLTRILLLSLSLTGLR